MQAPWTQVYKTVGIKPELPSPQHPNIAAFAQAHCGDVGDELWLGVKGDVS